MIRQLKAKDILSLKFDTSVFNFFSSKVVLFNSLVTPFINGFVLAETSNKLLHTHMQVSKLISGILFLKCYKLLLIEEGSELSLEQRWYCGMSTVLGICLDNEAH